MTSRALALAVAAVAMTAGGPALAQPAPGTPPAASGDDEGGGRIAFLALRRAVNRSFEGVNLNALERAQELRKVIEAALRLVSRRPVVDHEELVQLLTPRYLHQAMSCGNDAGCLARVAAPLVDHGVTQIVTAAYLDRGERDRFRFLVIDLPSGKVSASIDVELRADELDSVDVWRRKVGGLFTDTGELEISVDVTGVTCSIDRKPCDEVGDYAGGVFRLTAQEGNHLVELEKRSYTRQAFDVVVRRGDVTRVERHLEPINVEPTRPPSSRTDAVPRPSIETGAPAKEDSVHPFGGITTVFLVNDLDNGDVHDFYAVPTSRQDAEWGISLHPNSAYVGLSYSGRRLASGWETRGIIAVGSFTNRILALPVAQVQLVHVESGVFVTIGRMLEPVVNMAEPGPGSDFLIMGSLLYAFTGARVTKSFGRLVTALAVGRPEDPLQSEVPEVPDTASPLPFVEARVALEDHQRHGQLYGDEAPLTIAVSGAAGLSRVGAGEAELVAAIDPAAAEPRVEDLPTWIASAEAIVPIGPFTLVAEGYAGDGARVYGGALYQLARVDPVTGEHAQLRSVGGFGLAALAPRSNVELIAMAGVDRVVKNLAAGISIDGLLGIEQNLVVGGAASLWVTPSLRFSLEANVTRTSYQGGDTGTLHTLALESSLKF